MQDVLSSLSQADKLRVCRRIKNRTIVGDLTDEQFFAACCANTLNIRYQSMTKKNWDDVHEALKKTTTFDDESGKMTLYVLIKYDLVDVVRSLSFDPNCVIHLPSRKVSCGSGDETLCYCYEIERFITPLGVAVSANGNSMYKKQSTISVDMVRVLLQKGADPNLKWHEKSTRDFDWKAKGMRRPLARALSSPFDCKSAIALLLQSGAFIDPAQDSKGLAKRGFGSVGWMEKRLRIPFPLPPAMRRDVGRLLIALHFAHPKLHKDVVQYIAAKFMCRVEENTVWDDPIEKQEPKLLEAPPAENSSCAAM